LRLRDGSCVCSFRRGLQDQRCLCSMDAQQAGAQSAWRPLDG
jgi:hypothetical protein